MDIFSTMERSLQVGTPKAPTVGGTDTPRGCPESFLRPMKIALCAGTPKARPEEKAGVVHGLPSWWGIR